MIIKCHMTLHLVWQRLQRFIIHCTTHVQISWKCHLTLHLVWRHGQRSHHTQKKTPQKHDQTLHLVWKRLQHSSPLPTPYIQRSWKNTWYWTLHSSVETSKRYLYGRYFIVVFGYGTWVLICLHTFAKTTCKFELQPLQVLFSRARLYSMEEPCSLRRKLRW